MSKINDIIIGGIKNKIVKNVLDPINGLVDENLQDITTTIGSFIVRSVRGRFQRSIEFTVGLSYSDSWMEEALYGILYQYNNVKGSSRLELRNKKGTFNGNGMYYQLNDGTHNLKYRNYDILLCIQTRAPQNTARITPIRVYTIITYDLSPEFVTSFERDMISHRNSLLKIKKDSPVINVYRDLHEGDGYTYWEQFHTIPKRKLSTIYIQDDVKRRLVTAINEFFQSKEYYRTHGIAHNLKILLYGPPGPQPVSIEIPTPDGMRRFGDIKPGDYVFGLTGLPTLVEEVYEYKDLEVYEVEFSDGRKVKCSPSHRWPILTNSGNFIYKSTEDILKDNLLDDCGSMKVGIPLGNAVKFKHKDVPIDPWVLGVLISGDHLCSKDILMIRCNDDVLVKNLAIKTNAYVEESSDNEYLTFFDKDTKLPIKFAEFFKDLTELTDMNHPLIPDDYLINSESNRLALLQGLMDSGGVLLTNEDKFYALYYIASSMELAEQFLFLVRSLGFAAKIISDSSNNISHFAINIQCDQSDVYQFFRHSSVDMKKLLKDRFNRYRKYDSHNNVLFIKNITNLGYTEDMHCLHIEDGLHLYQTTEFAVTCNSGKDSIAKMIASEWNRNIYYITGGKDGKFIPNAIIDEDDDVTYPLMLISDIDKYPYLISEPDINIEDGNSKEEQIKHKQMFGNMINALDGILSGEDRIIIMTTNHIEKFSETFLRDSRVDIKEEIGYVTPSVFRKYTHDFYHFDLPEDIELNDDQLTVAKLQTDVVFRKLTIDEFLEKHVKGFSKHGK